MVKQNDFRVYSSYGKRGEKWEGEAETLHKLSKPFGETITGVCCTEDANRIFLSYENRVLFFKYNYHLKSYHSTPLEHKGVRSLCCTSDGSLLFLASPSKGVNYFSYEKYYNGEKYVHKGSFSQDTSINSLHCTPDDRYLMAGGKNGEVNVWEISKGKKPSLLLRKKIGNGNIKQVCSIKRNKDSVLVALLKDGNKSCIYALSFILCMEEIQRLIFQQEAKQAKHELEKAKEKIDCTKWKVEPKRKKLSKTELRKRWLHAARNLDFYAMEWLQVG